jgi:hypothetical protein
MKVKEGRCRNEGSKEGRKEGRASRKEGRKGIKDLGRKGDIHV